MNQLKNTSVLNSLILHANSLPGNRLTAQSFFVSVIDLIDGTFKLETKYTTIALEQFLKSVNSDLKNFKLRLSACPPTDADIAYMQQKIEQAREKAAKFKMSELTPEILVECIIREPSDAINRCANRQVYDTPPAPKPATPAQKPAPQSAPVPPAPDPNATESTDPKSQIAALTAKTKAIQKNLSSIVFGQEKAISTFATGYFQAELLSITDKTRTRPKATFIFAGPPGVGKTFLAEMAAKELSLPFMRFDMSEYSDHEANIEFCGSDKVYKNGKPGNVTEFVAKNPKCIILFDEIEKAHLNIIHLFLQMLDAGRLRDNFTDEEVSFKDAIIIFTTNAGKQLYENSDSYDLSDISRKVILKALEKDVNPTTGTPFFPAAMCSRFASGNVVMFNHISAHNLVAIARREIVRHADNFQREIGIKIEIEPDVYTSILFAEGGAADARTVRARAESFFDSEIYELVRLLPQDDISKLEKIKIDVDLENCIAEVIPFFKSVQTPDVLIFASAETAEKCRRGTQVCNFIHAETLEQTKKILKEKDIKVILLDIFCCEHSCQHYLNVEDEDSEARDLLSYVFEKYKEIPVYLVESGYRTYTDEEKVSFFRRGVRGTVTTNTVMPEMFGDCMTNICQMLHQQESMIGLAKANKIISYGTAQTISDDRKTAQIRLFDFGLSVAVDSEDSENILGALSKPDVKFENVIGAKEAKKELIYFIDYLKNPKKFLGTGVATPKGVILYGPPGTGKTLLAKAMANASDVTFISAEGNQFLKKYVGEGPEKVHELFKTARKYAPSILFIDEIDAIAKERRGGENTAAAEETLTAFLAEMDGFKNDPTKPVFVLAATNFEIEPGKPKSLDPALMRRFDRRVFVDLPDKAERMQYLRLKTDGRPVFDMSKSQFENIAMRSTGMSLAELESVIELALRSAIRDGDGKVTDEIFNEAFETFNSGEKKDWDVAFLERTARHEAGHALICALCSSTPSYLTIVARSNHGGYMQHAEDNKPLRTKSELVDKICISLGGRACEMEYYGDEAGVSTGASGDLMNATRIARSIICDYGMDDECGLATQPITDRDYMPADLHTAVNKILATQLCRAREIIRENRHKIDALVAALMDKNHLTGDEIEAIIGM